MNGNVLKEFLDTLALGEELEVTFRGRTYLIQGWDYSPDDPSVGPHIEMFDEAEGAADDYVFRYDGPSRGDCTRAFLAAKVWDGMDFDHAVHEIEWI